jgi:YD repeat-containing protein
MPFLAIRTSLPLGGAAGRQTGEHWLDGSSGGAEHFITSTFDSDDELTQAADSNATLTFAYDSRGRVTTAVTAGPSGTQQVLLHAGAFEHFCGLEERTPAQLANYI